MLHLPFSDLPLKKCPNLSQESFYRAFLELIFGKGMRTATFRLSESEGSLNRPDLFTELPFLQKSLPNPSFTELPPPFSLKSPFLGVPAIFRTHVPFFAANHKRRKNNKLNFLWPKMVRRAQSTRTAKFDPRTLSRKCSRKCPRKCTRRCPRKCPRRLRLFLCKAHQRVPTKTPTRVLTGKFPVLTGNFPVLTKMYTKVSSVNFHTSYFHMFCFLAKWPVGNPLLES